MGGGETTTCENLHSSPFILPALTAGYNSIVVIVVMGGGGRGGG